VAAASAAAVAAVAVARRRAGEEGVEMNSERGVALVVVLWIIVTLSLLIGGFAFTMHVETQVASFSRKELRAEMLARSGVELVRQQLNTHTAAEKNAEALNQRWCNNPELYVEHALGDGKLNVKVIDEESLLPINRLTDSRLRLLLQLLNVDPTQVDIITDSIQDWIDSNPITRLNGAESDHYLTLNPPYRAKNGPIYRAQELLMIRGITPAIYHGATDHPGLKDLIAPFTQQVNVNTASPLVLQVVLRMDENSLQPLLRRRNGGDGEPGTSDDRPFRSVDEAINEFCPRDNESRQRWAMYLTTNSNGFRVTSTGDVGGVRRTVVTTLQSLRGDYHPVIWTCQRGGP
jgi:general secretion pathway protein K